MEIEPVKPMDLSINTRGVNEPSKILLHNWNPKQEGDVQ
jgi:hypothetical protein